LRASWPDISLQRNIEMIARSLIHRSLAVGLAVASALGAAALRAQEQQDDPLPVKKVVLYNAGVGFFERRAEIDGNAKVDLKFNAAEINDLLKSMVLQDLAGGKISTVTYASMDPITKTLKTFAIDLTNNPTLANLLDQVRGEKVEIEAPNRVTGTILGVETREQQVGDRDKVVKTEFLNLLTDAGLRSFPMTSISRIKLLDAKLDGELRQALNVLALGHATDKKTVSLSFEGAGKRPVRVGYIQQSPIWRTTYRLVLSDKKAPFLQGWALVENTTEEDWRDVNLTLVSGRPISFVMNLYQPLYVNRPLVESELFASLRPQVYGQDMQGDQSGQWFNLGRGGMMGGQGNMQPGQVALRQRMAKGEPQVPAAAPATAESSYAAVADAQGVDARFQQNQLNLTRGVDSAAAGGDVGELFQYKIESPVTLPRQQSAMLPIVNGEIKGEKLSIYNANVQPKHPLNGFRLKNSTDLHLMQGPVTVFDDNTYAGDARIEDLPPGSERLISYALDLDVEVVPEAKGSPDQLTSVKIAKGTLTTTIKYERTQTYTVKNSGKNAKTVLIEYPVAADWKLIEPKEPKEKTRDVYRFAVTVEPGKPATLKIAEEKTVSNQMVLSNLDDNAILFYQRSPAVSAEVKKALAEVLKRKQQLQELITKRQEHEQTIATITQEQGRIRENMTRLDRNNDLYARYVKKFSEQEDQVEKAHAQIEELNKQINERQKSLDEYLLGLDLG
jgi:hypothetical protein